MSVFNNKKEKSYKEYCLIGLSRFSYEIGLILFKEGHKVTVLDSDQKKINELGPQFHNAIVCDSTNIQELTDIGIQYFDYIILGISDMEASVITSANLKELEVKKILCKAKDEKHRRILQLLGIDVSFIPEEEVATKIAYKAMHDLNVELFSFDDDAKDILLIKLPVLNQELWNKQVSELEYLKSVNATIISIKKKEQRLKIPVTGSDVIEEGDVICTLCRKDFIKKMRNYFGNK